MKPFFIRLASAIVFVGLIGCAIFGGPIFFSVTFALICGICLWEFLSFPNLDIDVRSKLFFTIIGLVPLALQYFGLFSYIFPFLGLTLLYIALKSLFLKQRAHANKGQYLAFGMLYITMPFFIVYLLYSYQNVSPKYPFLIAVVLILTWANDTGAYVIGSWLGKTKIVSKISPKKSLEGYIGGLICTGVVAYVLYTYIIDFQGSSWVILAVLISVFGNLGDLFESFLKRRNKIKDSGSIMPGDGGFLDRFDAFIFAIPVVYLYVYLFTK